MKLTIIINVWCSKRTFDLEKKYRSYGGKQGHLVQKLLIKQGKGTNYREYKTLTSTIKGQLTMQVIQEQIENESCKMK
jgi:hypothetical protein